MDVSPEFWWGLLSGGVAGVVIERALGRPIDAAISRSGRFARRHATVRLQKKADADTSLLRIGSDLIFVHAYSPAGLSLRSRSTTTPPLDDQWSDLPEDLRPADPHLLLHQLDAMRADIAADPSRWNEKRFGLARIHHGRQADTDRPVYDLVFHSTDFAASRFTEQYWAERRDRDDLLKLPHESFAQVLPGMSHSFGLNATVVTADDHLILVQRSSRTSSDRGARHISVNEGMNAADVDAYRQPDPVRALLRGLEEELGIHEVDARQVTLHSLVLDATRYQWALLGHVDLSQTGLRAADVLARRATGLSPDAWENSRIFAIPFTPTDVLEALREADQWIAHGWLNLLLSALSAFPERQSDLLDLLHGRMHGGSSAPDRSTSIG